MSELPNGWAEVPLEHCVDILDARRVPVNNKERAKRIAGKDVDELFPYYGATGIAGYIDDYLFDEQLVLLGEDGAPFFDTSKSKAYLISGKSWVNNHAHVLRAIDGLTTNELICHFLNQCDYSGFVNGATRLKLTQENMKKLPVRLAPINEQKRIADKLDRLLARVDAAKGRLDNIPALLKHLRQAILAAATTGKLTEEWRGDDRSDEGGMPGSWVMPKIGEMGRVQLGRQRSPKYHSGESMRPYLRVQNVFEDRIDLGDVMEMDFPGEDFERYRLHEGDILLNEGQSPEFLGRPAMYRGELPGACFTNTLIRFQAGERVNPEFALLVFRHHMHSGRYRAEGNITTNIAHLGAGRFANVEFPLPSMEEQNEIVRLTTELFAIAERIEAQYRTARARVDRLSQSLLAKAFRGELVPQDTTDEPAAALLERIRTQRAAAPKPQRGRRKKETWEELPMVAEPKPGYRKRKA